MSQTEAIAATPLQILENVQTRLPSPSGIIFKEGSVAVQLKRFIAKTYDVTFSPANSDVRGCHEANFLILIPTGNGKDGSPRQERSL